MTPRQVGVKLENLRRSIDAALITVDVLRQQDQELVGLNLDALDEILTDCAELVEERKDPTD